MSRLTQPSDLASSAVTIVGANLVLGVIAVGNTMVTAFYFGAGREIEIYFGATVLFNILIRLSQLGVIGEVLVPMVTDARTANEPSEVWRKISNFVNLMALTGVAVTLIVQLLGPLLVNMSLPGFGALEQKRAQELFFALLPLLTVIMVSAVLTSILNAYKYFGGPEWVKVLANSLALVFLFFAAPMQGLFALVWAMWLQTLLNLVGLFILLRRQGYRHYWVADLSDPFARRATRSLVPYLATTGVTQVVYWANAAILSTLAIGAMAAYRYADVFYTQIRALLQRPISTVAFTAFSESTAANNQDRLREQLAQAVQMMLFLSAPVVVLVLSSAEIITRVLWQRGEFDPGAVWVTAVTLSICILGLPLDSLLILERRTLLALNEIGLVNLSLWVSTPITLLFFWLLAGVAGAPGAATGVIIGLASLVLVMWIFIRSRYLEVSRFLSAGFLVRLVTLSIMMGVVAISVQFVLLTLMSSGNLDRFWQDTVVLILTSSLALGAFILGAHLLKFGEMQALSNIVASKSGLLCFPKSTAP